MSHFPCISAGIEGRHVGPFFSNHWAINPAQLFQPWAKLSIQACLGNRFLCCVPGEKANCFTSLSVVFPVSVAHSPASLQGLKLGPFVLSNVTTCKLFLAQKSSLRDLIFGLVSPARACTRAGARLPHLPKPPSVSP